MTQHGVRLKVAIKTFPSFFFGGYWVSRKQHKNKCFFSQHIQRRRTKRKKNLVHTDNLSRAMRKSRNSFFLHANLRDFFLFWFPGTDGGPEKTKEIVKHWDCQFQQARIDNKKRENGFGKRIGSRSDQHFAREKKTNKRGNWANLKNGYKNRDVVGVCVV
jgi:phosphorylcholine metabolism protein LicD